MKSFDGQIIKGYELKELIGEGGFGAVYRAYQPLIGREVAIKIILPQHANRPEFIRRFESEAQLVARLEHPFIVPLYDYWREPDGAFLVMRWLRGGSLSDQVRANGPITPAQVSRILSQIGEALTVAHRQGVIHRDLKLDNMMLDENQNTYLTDFGIAKDLGRNLQITHKDAILGSPAYLSPEQIKGEELTPQTDMYALGIAVFHMLTGDLPFDESTPAAMMYKHLSEPMPSITEKYGISSMIDIVLQRATAKEPSDRYPDILSFVKDFRRAVRVSSGEEGETDEVVNTVQPISTEKGSGYTTGITLPDPDNPYKGLRAFQQADASDFFGRSALTEQLLSRLKETQSEASFLAVVGPSGSGKSSVVKAGVVPLIKNGELPNSENWFVVEMVPGTEPLEELEAALLRVAINPPDSLLTQLAEDERGLVRSIKRVLPDDDSELVLVIDQFEEVFTMVDDEDHRQHFLSSILAAVHDERSRIRIIITLRADFYDKPLNYVDFGELLRERTEVVLPLSENELEEAITGPAQRVGLIVEPSLVQSMVSDVASQPGALPLLQYALTELFERRDGNLLTLKAYEEIGGTLGALAKRATELYAGLDEDGKEATRQMFLRLVTLGDGTEDTRRRSLQAELYSIGEDRDTMSLVIDAFGRYRLLTFDHDPQTRSATVEIAHEALIRQWQQLRDWLADSRDDLRLQRRLMSAAEDWYESNQDQSFLLRGTRLQQFEEWHETTTLAMNQEEDIYLKASINAREERDSIEQARIKREEALEARSQNILRILAGVMTVATIIAVGLTFIAFNQSQEAQEARDTAENSADEAQSLALAANARNALIEDDNVLGLSLALEANNAYSPQPIEVMRVLAEAAFGPGVQRRLQGHEATALNAVFNNDGDRSASVALDGTVLVWDNVSGDIVLQFDMPDDTIGSSVMFSPDGINLIVGALNGNIYIIDIDSGSIIDQIGAHEGGITSIDINSEGTSILSGSLDHTLRLFDLDSGELIQLFEGHTGVVLDVALSEDGQYATSSSGDEFLSDINDDTQDRTVRLWDLSTGDELHRFSPPPGYVRTVAFSPDSLSVISGTWNSSVGGTISQWNVRTGRLLQRFYGHTDIITGLAFLPDGSQIASVSWDRTVRIWDVETGIELESFETFEDRLQDVSVSADGEHILIPTGDFGGNEISPEFENSADTSIWLIDLRSRDELQRFDGATDWIWSMDINADETLTVSGSGPLFTPDDGRQTDTLVRLWDIETGEIIRTMDGHTETVEAIAFSPDGNQILSGAWDGKLILWNTETGEEIRQFANEDDFSYTQVIFTSDGEEFFVSTTAGTVIHWNIETGEEIQHFDFHEQDVDGIALNNAGTILAIGSYDSTITLWDIESGEQINTITGHTDRVNDIAFSPDDTRLASSSWDSTLRLWDVESGELLRTFDGHNGPTFGVTFHPDGKAIISGSSDTTVRLWDVDTGQELRRLDGHTNWISEVQFLGDGEFAISSAQDNTMRLWQVPRESSEIQRWAEANRYVRDLTCSERAQFRVESECDSAS